MTGENRTGWFDEAEIATVVNLKNRPDLRAALDGTDEHGDVVRIDRRTRWGNPFLIGRHCSREEVIERYRTWLWGKLRNGEIQVAELAATKRAPGARDCRCDSRWPRGLRPAQDGRDRSGQRGQWAVANC